MAALPSQTECDTARLRNYLVEALAAADKCDSLVAIHVETALAILDQRHSIQSSFL